jgi:hypothetical protein
MPETNECDAGPAGKGSTGSQSGGGVVKSTLTWPAAG